MQSPACLVARTSQENSVPLNSLRGGSVLDARDLTVRDTVRAIAEDVNLTLDPGEIVALVGESGAGKTAVSLALFAHARPGTVIGEGIVSLGGDDVLAMSASTLRGTLGRRLAFVPQHPGAALNPALKVADQIADVLLAHDYSRAGLTERVFELLESVALSPGGEFGKRYPHQLSGGQQQRAVLAIALACGPEVLVLDEPTTGLDVTTQSHVIELLARLRDELGTAMLYVTHNLAVVAQLADRVAVMYEGAIVEVGPTAAIFASPKHPYTRMLISAAPRLEGPIVTASEVASLGERTRSRSGCVFRSRCLHAQPACEHNQELGAVAERHQVRCVRWRDIVHRANQRSEKTRRAVGTPRLLGVRGLTASYAAGRRRIEVIKGVELEIASGECVAIVGASGSGKSTLARCVVGLHANWTGLIELDGFPLAQSASQRTADQRRRIQIIFQNPDRSLNPHHTVEKIVSRPMTQLLGRSERAAKAGAADLLEHVQLPRRYLHVYPTELSGGERQRVAIARALAAEGDLIVCDEITSALDVSVQAALIDLLWALREQHELSLLFISHDLSVVRAVADQIVVMEHGLFCEQNTPGALFQFPQSHYTQQLIAAAPHLPPIPDS